MTALGSMVRVHNWILDEKRQKLGDIERFVDKLKDDLRRLDESLEAERNSAAQSPEAGSTYAVFIAAALKRRAKLLETIENLDHECELARDEVQEAFQELKKYEIAKDHLDQRETAERQRREQLILDETGIGIYRRRAASRKGQG